MKLLYPDGSSEELPFPPAAGAGGAVSAVEVDAEDLHAMAALALRDPAEFHAAVTALAGRLGGAGTAERRALAGAISLVETCSAYPEAYDAMLDGVEVGHLRLRHGEFTVRLSDGTGRCVFAASPEGYGEFADAERGFYLDRARDALADAVFVRRRKEGSA